MEEGYTSQRRQRRCEQRGDGRSARRQWEEREEAMGVRTGSKSVARQAMPVAPRHVEMKTDAKRTCYMQWRCSEGG